MKRTISIVIGASLLTGCLPTPIIGLDGPGKVTTSRCSGDKQLSVDLPKEGHFYLSAFEDQGKMIVDLQFHGTKTYLLSTRAKVNTDRGYALLSFVAYKSMSRPEYQRRQGDESDDISVRGIPILKLNLSEASRLQFEFVMYDGSAEFTLPPLLVGGERVEVAPIRLTKKIGKATFCPS